MLDYLDKFKECGLRMTKPRKVILEQLQSPNVHLNADEIYTLVRKKLSHVSLGTVYRNLETLTRAGLLRKLNISGTLKHYDGGLHRHYHVRCVECGKVSDVSAEPFGDITTMAHTDGFKIIDHDLEFEGICQECQNNNNKERK